MKRIVALFLAALILLSFAACSQKPTPSAQPSAQPSTQPSAEPSAPPAEPQRLVIGHRANPSGLCPLIVQTILANGPVTSLLYDTLVFYNSTTGSFEPNIATDWEQIDATHIKFYLRKDVKAHDGSPITASDIIYTLKTGCESGKVDNTYGQFDLSGCEALDDYTVVIATKTPAPYLLYSLAYNAMGIVSENAVKNGGGLDAQGRNPTAGTGPYKFVSWVDGQSIILTKNEDYWGTEPFFDEVEFRIITDISARLMNLQAGDVDMILDVDLNQLQTIADNPEYQILNYPLKSVITAFFNCTKPPFDDVNVRRAIALAINYEANVEVAMGKYGYRCDSVLANRMDGYAAPDGSYTNYYHYDLEAAKALLAQTNYPNGFSFKLEYQSSAVYDTMVQVIKNQLAKLNIEVILTPVSASVFAADTQSGNFDMHMVSPGNPDPLQQLKAFDGRLTFAQANGGTGWNGGDEFNSLLDEAKNTLDADARNEILKQLQAIINSNVLVIPTGSLNRVYVADADLAGFYYTSFGDCIPNRIYRK